MFDKEPENWRELLGQITSDPTGMQHIIQELGVREITIKRWVSGISEPRHQNLRRLLTALPEYRNRFLDFFEEAFEDFSDLPFDESHQEISARFYTHVFQIRSTISSTQRYWSLANLIIGQALAQLDPDNVGLAISIVRCMIPAYKDAQTKILSLRESVGQANTYWPGNLEQHAMFQGAESIAGQAVENCRSFEVPNYKTEPHAPYGHQLDRVQSSIAYPILYSSKIAGCLLFSSTEPDFFLPPQRQNLVCDYAHLIGLAFYNEEFIDPSRIELRILPPQNEQKSYFASFRKRLADTRARLYDLKEDKDAELCVWEELEKEILNLN